jgi:hypothetical protein
MQGSIISFDLYGASGMENDIVFTIVSVVEVFEQERFFCATLVTQYCRSSLGNDCFWLVKNVSMLEEKLVFLLEKGIQEEGLSNL